MTYPQALFLAFIQGFTEFLPISSSGHLVLFQKLFGLKPPILFDILVHVGTLAAILFFFKDKLIQIIKGILKKEKPSLKLTWLIILGSLPAAVLGIALAPYLETIFNSLKLVGLNLIFTGILLSSTPLVKPKTPKPLNSFKALFIGFFQALAIFPGLSRSGATITAGIWQKTSKEGAFEFSFLLAIPAILGALLSQTSKITNSSPEYLIQGVIGLIIAALVGFWSLKILKKTLISKKFWLFGVYCFLLGLVLAFL